MTEVINRKEKKQEEKGAQLISSEEVVKEEEPEKAQFKPFKDRNTKWQKFVDFFRMSALIYSIILTSVWGILMSPLNLFENVLVKYFHISRQYCPGPLFHYFSSSIYCSILNINVKVANKNVGKEGCIYIYNHTSNLDPVLMTYVCNQSIFTFKKSLMKIPLVGQCFWLQGHYPIDRNNREESVNTLNTKLKKLLDSGRSVCIAPEGTRSRTGEVLPFKKGPFHLAMNTGKPIVPVLISGSYELCPPGSMRADAGTVEMHVFPPMEPKVGEESVEEFMDRVHKIYEEYPPHLTKELPNELDAPIIYILLFSAIIVFIVSLFVE